MTRSMLSLLLLLLQPATLPFKLVRGDAAAGRPVRRALSLSATAMACGAHSGPNLRKILFRVQSLPWADGVQSEGGAVRFEAETDVAAFESALREGRIADAVALYRGELLPGFEDDQSDAWNEWLQFERNRLPVAWRGAVLERLERLEQGGDGDAADASGDAEQAIALSARLLAADPLDESALRAQLAALAKIGDATRARRGATGWRMDPVMTWREPRRA